ncbi:lysozyme [Pantoea sp. BAV 3049]|uniref:lysozyme n=1 Tax=Pantoea sp. BAV 3049 TaxID=2654188 RepID=UPI00131C20FC|nr:lysozyme [Pantoea sp. BAV 3049]
MSLSLKTSERGKALIKQFEGCRLSAYQDDGGVWTIGWGWTRPVDGVDIHSGMTITQVKADALFSEGLVDYEQAVCRLVTVPLTQNQFDALVCFTYNLGPTSLQHSTLLAKLNAGDYAGAAAEFDRWIYINRSPFDGLIRRRAAEKALFLEAAA